MDSQRPMPLWPTTMRSARISRAWSTMTVPGRPRSEDRLDGGVAARTADLALGRVEGVTMDPKDLVLDQVVVGRCRERPGHALELADASARR